MSLFSKGHTFNNQHWIFCLCREREKNISFSFCTICNALQYVNISLNSAIAIVFLKEPKYTLVLTCFSNVKRLYDWGKEKIRKKKWKILLSFSSHANKSIFQCKTTPPMHIILGAYCLAITLKAWKMHNYAEHIV